MALSFFDMAVSLTPPTGHAEPMPLNLGPNWKQNDLRVLMVSASASFGPGETDGAIQMHPAPPAGFTSAYSLNPSFDTKGVYWRRLVAGDSDTNVSWAKPTSWTHFVWSVMTVRGASPTVDPTGGAFTVTHTMGAATATIGSVSVPAAGVMVFCVGTVPDPDGGWPSWASSMSAPAGWTNMVATDKSGSAFDQYAATPSILVVGKTFASSGSTGSVTLPISQGQPAFTGLWLFVQPAADVSITVGAA